MNNDIAKKKDDFRCGYVAIIGKPNVGKSTLMNTLLGQKISIVTKKPQTTRHKILGILSSESHQIIFLDTPGLIKPNYLLQSAMMDAVKTGIDEADVILFMIDAQEINLSDNFTNGIDFKSIKDLNKPVLLVINKVDTINKLQLLPAIEFYSNNYPFVEIFPISALKGVGTEILATRIASYLPKHEPFYPLDVVSDASERFFVSEIIREKIFEYFQKEIPYSTSVEIIEFKERSDKKDFISADIYVERSSQKGILIGKSGAALKKVGELARKDIELFLSKEVFLELHVKVREKWRGSEAWLKRLGYKVR